MGHDEEAEVHEFGEIQKLHGSQDAIARYRNDVSGFAACMSSNSARLIRCGGGVRLVRFHA